MKIKVSKEELQLILDALRGKLPKIEIKKEEQPKQE